MASKPISQIIFKDKENKVVKLKTFFVDKSDAYIVETWHNETSWYRVWSDGWIEQGGLTPQGTSYETQTVNLPKAMTTDTYNIFITSKYATTTEYGCDYFNEKTTTNFKCTYARLANWYVCGY